MGLTVPSPHQPARSLPLKRGENPLGASDAWRIGPVISRAVAHSRHAVSVMVKRLDTVMLISNVSVIIVMFAG